MEGSAYWAFLPRLVWLFHFFFFGLRERERERERKGGREREREGERESTMFACECLGERERGFIAAALP